jgi:hypothetical protein
MCSIVCPSPHSSMSVPSIFGIHFHSSSSPFPLFSEQNFLLSRWPFPPFAHIGAVEADSAAL